MTRNLLIAIEGMSCDGCVRSVTNVLERLPGVAVTNVTVGAAEVGLEAGKATEEDLRGAVEKAGFSVRAITARPD